MACSLVSRRGSIALGGRALGVIGGSQIPAESGSIQMCGQSSRVSGSPVVPQLREEPVAGAGGFDRTAVTETSLRDPVPGEAAPQRGLTRTVTRV